jgi:predicted Zn-dependent peptidase
MRSRRPVAIAWSMAGALACAGSPQRAGVPHPSRAEPVAGGAPAALTERPWSPRLPRVAVQRLPSGMVLLIVGKATPVATLALAVRHARAAAEPQVSEARALERLMAAVSPGSGSSVIGDIEDRGGSLRLEAARDHSVLSATVLTSDIPYSLERLAALAPAELDMHGAADLEPGAGGAEPRLQPSDMALIVVGDVRPEQVARHVVAAFGAWRVSTPPEPRLPELAVDPGLAGPRIVLVDQPGATESTLVAWQRMPARTEPGHEAREVMAQALGGVFNSRLNLSLRERHTLSYGCWARLLAGRAGGTLLVSTRVPTLRTAAALRELMLELHAVGDSAGGRPFGDEEIQTAKRHVLMSIELQAEHAAGMIALLSAAHAAELPWEALVDYPARLNQVDAAAVRLEAERLDPRAMTVVITGNRAHIDAEIHVVADALSRLPARR